MRFVWVVQLVAFLLVGLGCPSFVQAQASYSYDFIFYSTGPGNYGYGSSMNSGGAGGAIDPISGASCYIDETATTSSRWVASITESGVSSVAGLIDFTTPDGTTFSVLDQDPVLTPTMLNPHFWHLTLQDVTTGEYLYKEVNGSVVGAVTGELVGGDLYQIRVLSNLLGNTNETLTYDPSISFASTTTPEPSSLVLLCTGLTGMAAAFRRRLAANRAS